MKINGWKWHTQIGAGDATSTGIVTGYAWGQKVWSLELSDNICILSTYQFEITPVFQGKGFASRCELTASFRIFRAIKLASNYSYL